MSLTTQTQTNLPFQAGQQYDGAEVLAYLSQIKPETTKSKRAPSAYNCFMADKTLREQLKQEHPDMSPKDVMGALAKKWNSLTEHDKAAYKPAVF